MLEGISKVGLAALLLARFGVPALVLAGILSSVVFSNVWLNVLTSKLLKESFFRKVLPLVLIVTIPLVGLVSYVSIKHVLYILITIVLLTIATRKLLDYKDLIRPFYVQIFNRNSKKLL